MVNDNKQIGFTIKIEYASDIADRAAAKEKVRSRIASGLQKLFQTPVNVSAKDTKTGLNLVVNVPEACRYSASYCLDKGIIPKQLNLPQNYRASIIRREPSLI